MKKEIIVGKYQGGKNFGFLIPDDRNYYGGDFFVKVKNSMEAETGEKVEGEVLPTSKGKKPEVKIIKIFGKDYNISKKQNLVGIFSAHGGDFGFVDVEGDKGYFCYNKYAGEANDGDLVEAKIRMYKGKEEAIVTKVLENNSKTIEGVYKDNESFGFVKPLKKVDGEDIFIAGAKKNEAEDGDKVIVQIIKNNGRRAEGIIREITLKNPNKKEVKEVIEEESDDDLDED